MKYSKDSPGSNMALVPLECQNPNLMIGCEKNVMVVRALQKERRKNKRREKENMWRRNNHRNAKNDPVVVHFPARSNA
ncbi:uncharacterized protein LOC125028038 isoform X2 [Penaeus chinensis]|nr:uncharacterized protein LOC125028038 isoform X2 [Penaeus chinensis]